MPTVINTTSSLSLESGVIIGAYKLMKNDYHLHKYLKINSYGESDGYVGTLIMILYVLYISGSLFKKFLRGDFNH